MRQMSFEEMRQGMSNFWYDNKLWAVWDKRDWRKLECQLRCLQQGFEQGILERLRTDGNNTSRQTLEGWASKAALAKQMADTLTCWQRETEALGN